jgi:micrococcal nuclease|tara:strand:+ start:228 stop:590 length:363 start_codon:yes stop_codon:yes gene_type:complete
MYEYRCSLVKVIDGDTIDVCIDLGFKVTLSNERVRLSGIDTPESRTRNLEEKKLGLAAKARLKELLPKKFVIRTVKDDKGKFGRILGIPFVDDIDICQQLIEEGHAREYSGKKKKPWIVM